VRVAERPSAFTKKSITPKFGDVVTVTGVKGNSYTLSDGTRRLFRELKPLNATELAETVAPSPLPAQIREQKKIVSFETRQRTNFKLGHEVKGYDADGVPIYRKTLRPTNPRRTAVKK
jgi:hypothetical protein